MAESGGEGEEEEESFEFTECGFCGISAGGDDDGGFDFDSAFAKTSSNAKAGTNAPASAKQTMKLLKCIRCKTIAYCSRACQRNHYREHKAICRQIGREKETKGDQGQDAARAGMVGGGDSGSALYGKRESGGRGSGPEQSTPQMGPVPKKGVPAPIFHPRTSIIDQIDVAAMNMPIVLHCDSESSPAFNCTGVYSPRQLGSSICYIYEPEASFNMLSEMAMNEARWAMLEDRGYHFYFSHVQGRRMLSQSPNGGWSLHSDFGDKFSELEIPRSRDKAFWDDPQSLLRMSPSDVYSTWTMETAAPARRQVQAKIALTPVGTLMRAAKMACAPPVPSHKYQRGRDFAVWNRSFVLHVDPRTCQLPSSWIDSLTGVYSPLHGKLASGYPVWKRQCAITKEVVNSIPDGVRECLESRGVRIGYPGDVQRLLFVRKDNGSSPSLLSVTEGGDAGALRKANRVLEASYVPSTASELLTEPALLFSSPDQSFSTWNAYFEGQRVEIHAAMTPLPFFRQAISLTTLETETGDKEVDSGAMASNKKKRAKRKKRKKKPPAAAAASKSNPGSLGDKPEGNRGESDRSAPLQAPTTPSDDKADSNTPRREHSNATAEKKKWRKRKPKPVKTTNDGLSEMDAVDEVGAMPIQTEGTIGRLDDAEDTEVIKEPEELSGTMPPFSTGEASHVLQHLASLVKADTANVQPTSDQAFDASRLEGWSVDDTLKALLEGPKAQHAELDPHWLQFNDSVTSPIFEAAASSDDCKWIEENASELVTLFSKHKRRDDLTALLSAGVRVTAVAVATLLSSLPRGRGDAFNNKICKVLCLNCEVTMDSSDDYGKVIRAASHTVGKATKRDLTDVLKKASAELQKSKKQLVRQKKAEAQKPVDPPLPHNAKKDVVKAAVVDEKKHARKLELTKATEKIQGALKWYSKLLEELLAKSSSAATAAGDRELGTDRNAELSPVEDTGKVPSECVPKEKSIAVLTSEEVIVALSKCETEDALASVETGIDLFAWDSHSAWTIDITEQAHKWFRRHMRKDRALCERILRRLTLLSTGRWPYVLCKPLKARKVGAAGKKINLYETKIDSASRIIWEVAIAFSPRRSSLDQSFCEQVIRVWDIVLDHDNLSRAIDQTVERIERSHARGEDCAIYAELDKTNAKRSVPSRDGTGITRIPRVFPMSNEVASVGSARGPTPTGRSRHFHPASDDPRQFTLLKFYERQEENVDLPFTPGPKEHEIIHYESHPKRSILLMGRSGTGKTTCLVFRMWAQHASYVDGEKASLKQLFLTKNEVLCREVERSFNNMGLAWRKRGRSEDDGGHLEEAAASDDSKQTRFVTSNEWLETLDVELPGESFFSQLELEQRIDDRRQKDTVIKGVEALLSEEVTTEREASSSRQEMQFPMFRKLWRKIRSGSGSKMDSVLVWREIKSFIKGSVPALHIGTGERMLPQNRFLSLDEYLALPKKQSRMDEAQRREVYDLYLRYEKIKREMGLYDECDLVYNIAGRISLFDFDEMDSAETGLLPIDAMFVDEVQDFTQAELWILAKLCRDPNNLFLAGDTAQSIAVGVDFRFTDVRQIFFNQFGGIEPKLRQLSHNYRSHAGVLRLAACVVELLYYFFSSSLDRLPPDLGLFDGPKPVIMEVTSTADLILMLDGAKRETSRIEFGAHQVVIVRSEEAKKALPDEFGVDRDWVMTVQQSKGLEFDDVLLYNFFSDSPAGDAWRVVSNYTKADIDEYYSGVMVQSSGVQSYEWEDSLLSTSRHLDFSADQHKILETEFKMLYTAITRARVNVFIAETDAELSRPMFDYFRRRSVVDVVNRDSANGLSGVRVFGAMNSVDDWRSRGEYYLQNAEGERQKGCLRLAAKCFDKSGDVKRRDFALAFLAFTEIEEHDHSKKRGKHSFEWREKLYSITGQLLDARDVGFLSKAALCLLRVGEHDGEAAKMLELYARLCYAQRMCADGAIVASLTLHEKKYFSSAGKLFAKCVQRKDAGVSAIDAIRCYLCGEMYDAAAAFIDSGALPVRNGKAFEQLSQLCLASNASHRDPIASFQRDFVNSPDSTALLKEAINKVAKLGCRELFNDGGAGFSAALGLLSMRSDRVQLLSSIDESADCILSKKPWASHPAFNVKSDASKPDFTSMLVSELKLEKRHKEVAEILESRGYLLEAAAQLDELSDDEHYASGSLKPVAMRVKYVELMLLSSDWRASNELSSILDGALADTSIADIDTKCSSLLSSALLSDGAPHRLLSVVSKCKDSILWQNRALQLLFDRNSNLIEMLPGSSTNDRLGFIYDLAQALTRLGSALRNPTARTLEDSLLISQAERYFELTPNLNPSLLETIPVVNSRLREVTHSEQCRLPFSSPVASRGFTQKVDKGKMHQILSKFVRRQAALLLMKLNDLAEEYEQQKKSLLRSMPILDLLGYVQCLQLHIMCKRDMATLCAAFPSNEELWKGMDQRADLSTVLSDFLGILLHERRVPIVVAQEDDVDGHEGSDSIVLLRPVIESLAAHSTDAFTKLSIKSKKCDIMQTVMHWRTNHLCTSFSVANAELHKHVTQLEKHLSTKNDKRHKRRHYFINKKGQIFPRLWLWVVESSQIMNSISVSERMIRTSTKDGLVPISKLDQITLLEVSAVALFGSLALRYSEVDDAPSLLIPTSYLQALLTGETGLTQFQGFGTTLKDTILPYCHKHFAKVFQDVVLHLEATANIMLSSKLLSWPEDDKDEWLLGKVLVLSTFICCNAIIFSKAGKDMDVPEYQRDMSTLPSLPLQGNVAKLVGELRAMLGQNRHLLPGTSLSKPPSSFADLVSSLEEFLRGSTKDNFVLCKLTQKSEDEVDVQTSSVTSQVQLLLANITLDARDEAFANPFTKSASFLNEADLGHDEMEHGRQSEELNARKTIIRFIKGDVSTQAWNAIIHFKCWELSMRSFVRQVKRWAVKKALDDKNEIQLDSAEESNVLHSFILERLFNPFQDPHTFQRHREAAKANFCNALVDGIECSFCGVVFDPAVQRDRFVRWGYEGQGVTYPMFATYFNKMRFGVERIDHPESIGHVQTAMHQDNVVRYMNNLDMFATVMARIAMSLELLYQMLPACEEAGRVVDVDSLWYLNTAEESRTLIAQLQRAQGELANEGAQWSRQPALERLWAILQDASGLPHHAESFFMKKKAEEVDMKQRKMDDDGDANANDDDAVENPIDELVRGPYLNPDAPAFTPQFGA